MDNNHFRKFFSKNKWTITSNPTDARLILVNTCAYDYDSEENSFEKIKELKKKTKAKIIVCGCLPKINEERLKREFKGIYFGIHEISKLDGIIDSKFKIEKIKNDGTLTAEEFSVYPVSHKLIKFIKPILQKIHSKFNIKIQPLYNICSCLYGPDVFHIRISIGCLGNCTYCAIKHAKGSLKSVPIHEIISKFKDGLNKGCKEFALIGQEVGCYGQDINTSIVELLKEMNKVKKDYKLHILFLEPSWFLKYFDGLKNTFVSNNIVSINLTLQSSNDRIIRMMGRKYKVKEVIERVRELKKEFPSITLRTHLMVGFPGETEKEFKDTLRVMGEFDFVNGLFMYTGRPGCPSSQMPNQVPKNVKRKRLRKLKIYRIYHALRGIRLE